MDENRADHQIGGRAADERPAWSGPGVHDLHVDGTSSISTILDQLPHHLHAAGDTPDVRIPNLSRGPIDRHLRDPPRRILDEAAGEGTPGGHLHQPAVEQADTTMKMIKKLHAQNHTTHTTQ